MMYTIAHFILPVKAAFAALQSKKIISNDQAAKLRSLITEVSYNFRNKEMCHVRDFDEEESR